MWAWNAIKSVSPQRDDLASVDGKKGRYKKVALKTYASTAAYSDKFRLSINELAPILNFVWLLFAMQSHA